jgi:RimJ/RimL family protein N-acetyltransferase
MGESPLTDGVVTLRAWIEADAPEVVACVAGDDELGRWLDRLPQPYGLEDALAYIRGEVIPDELKFAITEASSGRILGSIGLTPSQSDVVEIGYWMRADARGAGYMTRALVLASRWAVSELGAARVQLRADVENVASCRVAEKAGFRRDGVLRSAYWNERLKRRQDWAMYSLLPDELA